MRKPIRLTVLAGAALSAALSLTACGGDQAAQQSAPLVTTDPVVEPTGHGGPVVPATTAPSTTTTAVATEPAPASTAAKSANTVAPRTTSTPARSTAAAPHRPSVDRAPAVAPTAPVETTPPVEVVPPVEQPVVVPVEPVVPPACAEGEELQGEFGCVAVQRPEEIIGRQIDIDGMVCIVINAAGEWECPVEEDPLLAPQNQTTDAPQG